MTTIINNATNSQHSKARMQEGILYIVSLTRSMRWVGNHDDVKVHFDEPVSSVSTEAANRWSSREATQ